MSCLTCALDYRTRLEGMVADTAAEVAELRARYVLTDAHRELELMNFELNGLCMALRAFDEDYYASTSFTDPAWIEAHRTEASR